MEAYHKVWYKLHVSPDSSRWTNVLILTELCFSLPFSNGSVERVFSTTKLIKTDRRTRLHRDTLSDIMEIKVEGPSLNAFSPKQAVEAWWRDCKTSRRPNQSARKQFSPGDKGADGEDLIQKKKCSNVHYRNGMPGSVKLRVALQPTQTKL